MIERIHRPTSREGAGLPVRCEKCSKVFRLAGLVPETASCPYCGEETATVQPRETTDC